MKCRESLCRSVAHRVDHIVYLFEGFRLDAARRQLSSSGGVVVPLNSRAMEALVLLVSRAGDLVSKRELLEGVWPAAVVEDNNINQCILAIRKALGESAGSNRFIMTVPGRGYRFVAPVILQRRESPEAAAPEPGIPGEARRWKTLALPGLAVATILVVLALDASHDEVSLEKPTGTGDLIVHLRSDNTASPAPESVMLLECLRQHPELHLKVQVQIVGSESAPPIWTGSYIAGAQDLHPDSTGHGAGGDACHRLAAR